MIEKLYAHRILISVAIGALVFWLTGEGSPLP